MRKLLILTGSLLLICGLLAIGYISSNGSSYSSLTSKAEYIEPIIDPSLSQPKPTKESKTESPILSEQEQAELDAYLRQLAAGNRIKQQLEELQNLSGDDQEQLAQSMLRQVDNFFEQKQINQSELLFLKLAVMKYVMSPDSYKEYANREIKDYEQLSQQKWQEYLNNRSPEFIDYKQKERELVERIMQMNSFPDGLTREQYLRQEIEKLKAEAYGFEKSQEG